MRTHLGDALNDDWGANAFEELISHLEPVLADIRSGHQNDEARSRVSALGAQLQMAEQVHLLAMSAGMEGESKVLLPLLKKYSTYLSHKAD